MNYEHAYFPDFLKYVEKNSEQVAISTGFKNLDNILEGGLYPGLYVLGAISSIGKTTFALQMADNIAQSGRTVFFYSLEMAKNELIAKVFSHRLAQIGQKHLTTRDILNGALTEKDIKAFTSFEKYDAWCNNSYFFEGNFNIGVSQISDCLTHYEKEKSAIAPVIFIDYLQTLAPYYETLSDKQAIDKNILELKRLSRDFNTPVFVISSLNRESYYAPVSMASFKESGAIEYSADVLIGLQYYGFDYEESETDTARKYRLREVLSISEKQSIRGIQLKILKNRNGERADIFFNYYPDVNTFSENSELNIFKSVYEKSKKTSTKSKRSYKL